MSEAEKIAAGLSDAQRLALLGHRMHQAWGGRTDERLPSWPEAGHGLRMKNLIHFVSETSSMTELSEKGHQVRAALQRFPTTEGRGTVEL